MEDFVLRALFGFFGTLLLAFGVLTVWVLVRVAWDKWQSERDLAYARRCCPCDCPPSGGTDPYCLRHGHL